MNIEVNSCVETALPQDVGKLEAFNNITKRQHFIIDIGLVNYSGNQFEISAETAQ